MKIKFNFIGILTFVLFFIYMPPSYLLLNDKFADIIEFFQLFTAAFIFFSYLLYIKKNKVDIIILLTTIFWIIFIISTYIHKGSISAAFKPLLGTFSLCAYFDMNKAKFKSFFKYGLIYFEIIILINFITVILFPNGLYMVYKNVNPHYFLGHRNNSIEYILPAICFRFLHDHFNDKKISAISYVLIIISLITVILTWSANAILVIVFMLLSLYLPTKSFIQKILNCKNFFVAYLIIFFAIVVYRLQYYFEWLIVDILHRSLDFTDRTFIWDKSIFWIKKSLLIGYGYEQSELKMLKIGHPNSSHNYLLDFMYMGGILSTIVILIMLFLIFKKLRNNKSYVSIIMTFSLCSYFILWFATPIHKDVLCIMFLIFMIAYNIDFFGKEVKNEKI